MAAREVARRLGGAALSLGLLLPGLARAEQGPVDRLTETKALIKAGKYAEAESRARALLAEVEASGEVDSVATARVLDVLVDALLRGGKSRAPETRELAERAVRLRERGADDAEKASGLKNLGALLYFNGDYAGARPLWERVLAIREKTLGPDDPEVAKSLNNLAVLLRAMGAYAEARSLYERSLAIFQKAYGPDHPDVGDSLNNLATVLYTLGDYAAARSLFERALAIREKALGPDHPDVAQGLNNLGLMLETTGDYAAARPLFERALTIREKALGPDHPDVATSADSLAHLLQLTGDYPRSRALYERALAIREKALGPDHPAVAASLDHLALLLWMMRDYVGARPLYERALSIRERTLGPDHPEVAQSLENLGRLLSATGDYAAARPLYERALPIFEKALGPEHLDVATSLDNLATLYRDTGDFDAARPVYERAIEIRTKLLGRSHPDLAVSLNDLARALAARGDTAGALERALEGERIAREHLERTGLALSEREVLRYAAARTSGLDVLLTLAARRADAPSRRRVLDALVRSRALVLDQMAARHRAVSGAADPATVRLTEALAAARARLANLVLRGPGDKQPELHRKLIDEARGAEEQAERALAAASASFAQELSGRRVGLDEVAASLGPGSALVATAEYERLDPKAKTPGTLAYLAFVLRAGERDPQVIDLGDARKVDSLIERWRKQASGDTLAHGTPREAEAAYREAGADVARNLWEPIAGALLDAKRVFVVPDGSLNLVSLASLPVAEGGYLVEHGPLLHYLSAERDLVLAAAARHGAGLLTVGGASYDATTPFAALRKGRPPAVVQPAGGPLLASNSPPNYRGPRAACGDFAAMRFEPLPATAKETREIVELWKKQEETEVRDLRDAAASESEVKRSAPGRRVIHLATHGFFLGAGCGSSFRSERGIGGLAETQEAKAVPDAAALAGENPLLLSGLVLAGANHRASAAEGEDDGILTAEEIASLDLSGVEWAVLSACDTGLGDVRAGEGVFGLRRAFQIAGARTLIMSLWSVDDETTRAWMKALYLGRLEEHRDTAQAVQRASLTLLEQRRRAGLSTHPFYWGAFVAAGDWR